MASPREENVYMAKLAEQSERYEEMVEFMEKVVAAVDGGDELTVEERNLLSVAYKHVIGARRASWQIISSMEQKEESRGNKDYVASIKTYRSKIETELTSICNGILKLLDSKLIGSAATGDSKVFYLKMKGDYYGYLAEFKTGAERKEAAKNSLSANKFAQLAEQAESDKEMVEFMEKVIADELTVEECDNLSIAYKKVIGARRASWQIISSIEKKEKSLRGNEDYRVAFIKTYRSKIETDVTSICNGILKLLDSKLIGSAATADMKVFYLKMKGDYYRYLAEFKTGAERKEAVENTLSAYKSAQDIANAELAPTHTMRLGLALNFSVFYYDILNSPDRACILAKQAIDEAIVDLDLVEVSKDSISILQLLRDNLTLWIYAG